MIEVICQTCSESFLAYPSAKRKYCSKRCYPRPGYVGNSEGRSGSGNSKWKGGIMYDNGRKLIYAPEHPNAYRGYIYEYRMVASATLGRPLTQDEVVHHIDGDVTNNSPENLQVMTQSEHCSLHTTQMHAEGRIRLYDGPRGKDGKFLPVSKREELHAAQTP